MDAATRDATLSRLFQPSLGVLFVLIGVVTFVVADGGRDVMGAATWVAFGLAQTLAPSASPPVRWTGYGFAAVGAALFGVELVLAFG